MRRTYVIPLRRSFRETERYNKTKRAVSATRTFLMKHMKAEEVKLGQALNIYLWERGGRNPPHKVTVVCEKNDEGIVYADLEGERLPSEIAAEQAALEKAEKEQAAKEKAAAEKVAKEKAAAEKVAKETADAAAKDTTPVSPPAKKAGVSASAAKSAGSETPASDKAQL